MQVSPWAPVSRAPCSIDPFVGLSSRKVAFPTPRTLPLELASDVRRWIEEVLADEDPRIGSVSRRELAGRYEALPLYADMAGCVLLRPDGSFLAIEWEAADVVLPVSDPWRVCALAFASRKYPALRCMLPYRPVSAADCPACRGTGRPLDNAEGVICAHCVGLGWALWDEPPSLGRFVDRTRT